MFANNLVLSVHETSQSDHNQQKSEIQRMLHKHLPKTSSIKHSDM